MSGKDDVSKQLAAEFEHSKPALDQAFWSPEMKSYAFALKQDNQRADEASVLTTVPMWFGLPDADHADQTITQLAAEDHQTDWGMRIISQHSKVYDGSGYHYGSVWPLFTGWASVGEYRYHRAFPAYSNLRANALARRRTARSAISPKFSPETTTSRSRPVRRTRSGLRPW